MRASSVLAMRLKRYIGSTSCSVNRLNKLYYLNITILLFFVNLRPQAFVLLGVFKVASKMVFVPLTCYLQQKRFCLPNHFLIIRMAPGQSDDDGHYAQLFSDHGSTTSKTHLHLTFFLLRRLIGSLRGIRGRMSFNCGRDRNPVRRDVRGIHSNSPRYRTSPEKHTFITDPIVLSNICPLSTFHARQPSRRL